MSDVVGALRPPAGPTRSLDLIENRTFDELQAGDTASLVRTLTYEDVELFAVMSGDVNPAHLDETFGKSDLFTRSWRTACGAPR